MSLWPPDEQRETEDAILDAYTLSLLSRPTRWCRQLRRWWRERQICHHRWKALDHILKLNMLVERPTVYKLVRCEETEIGKYEAREWWL